jgi:SAM-dependent methyltransferase
MRRIPTLGKLARKDFWTLATGSRAHQEFPGSKPYWEQRYLQGGNSGVGSYRHFAQFKAQVLNEFVAEKRILSVIEFGCGDGNQLRLAKYPRYLGFDVSPTAIAKCKEIFGSDETKSFHLVSDFNGQRAELSLSLDVIYHLVEDDVFESYMQTLFAAADCYVIIYSSDSDDNRGYEGTHVRHRKFTGWVSEKASEWRLTARIPNKYPYRGDYRTGSFADFFVYERSQGQ